MEGPWSWLWLLKLAVVLTVVIGFIRLFVSKTKETVKSLTSLQANLCRENSKSFFFASLLYPALIRQRVFCFYAFARVADDLIDEVESEAEMEQNISLLKELVEHLDTSGKKQKTSHDELCLLLAKHTASLKIQGRDKSLSLEPETLDSRTFKAFTRIVSDFKRLVHLQQVPAWSLRLLIDGFQHDAETHEISDETELLKYCLGVASSIGIVCSFLFADNKKERVVGYQPQQNQQILALASCLGIGMQLTNIARDILTDADLGRTYIPNTWLKEHKLTPAAFLELTEEEKKPYLFIFSLKLLEVAETYYEAGWNGVSLLPREVQLAVSGALLIYREIGFIIQDELRTKRRYPRRAFTTKKRKLALMCKAQYYLATGIQPIFHVNPAIENKAVELLDVYIT